MINEIDIRHFRCFEHLRIDNCRRINVIVGENGTGKSALLEAIFFALGVSSDLTLRYRQHRGMDGSFRASARKISDALFGDFFHNLDQTKPISISLMGTGPEARSLEISRGAGGSELALDDAGAIRSASTIHFHWKDAAGRDHFVVPKLTPNFQFPETGEDLPDFFYFAANQLYSSVESAERFSDLSRARRQQQFVDIFRKEYSWIEDLAIEVVAGAPGIFATLKNVKDKIAVNNVSGGINRIITILLAIASRPRSVVLADEIENGLYYKHHQSYWSALISFARNYDSQLFLTTHSAEWLGAMVRASGDKTDDIALWRLEREDDGRPTLLQFDGTEIRDAIEYGSETRGL